MSDRSIQQYGEARRSLMRGVDRMTRALRPTLGPVGRTVAIAPIGQSGPPEVLDSASTIARRILRLEDPFESMGGRLVRDLVWQVNDVVGDGAATAAVLNQRLIRQANKYIVAGGNPMILKRGIEKGLSVALDELRRLATPVELPEELAGVVAGTVRDPKLAKMVGEVLESVGPDGAVLFEDSARTETIHQYIEGVRWNEGIVSSYLFQDDQKESRILNPRIFITNFELNEDCQLLPVIDACLKARERNLFVVAPKVSGSALSLLIVNQNKGVLDSAIAVKAPGAGPQRRRILEDLAVITGARCVSRDGDDQFGQVMIHDLGRARQVWATRFAFGILGGEGSRGAIRQRLSEVRAELDNVGDHKQNRARIQERIGKLSGTAALIRVGAQTKSARQELRPRLEAAVASARSALRYGVVPGGGASYLACRPALAAIDLPGDEGVGVKILSESLAEPMAVIAKNAGLDASPIVYRASQGGPTWTFDAVRKEWVDPWEAGILDPLSVTEEALRLAVSTAIMAITTEVLIRKRTVDWDEEKMKPSRRRSV